MLLPSCWRSSRRLSHSGIVLIETCQSTVGWGHWHHRVWAYWAVFWGYLVEGLTKVKHNDVSLRARVPYRQQVIHGGKKLCLAWMPGSEPMLQWRQDAMPVQVAYHMVADDVFKHLACYARQADRAVIFCLAGGALLEDGWDECCLPGRW